MSSGFFALLDDIAAIAKVAAASLDDAGVQAVAASKKAAGIVIDDAAVTPRYVVGYAANRELPIIGKIAWGSLKNKLLYLLPGALVLSYFAPWLITPLLMAGGLFLCFEGYEKVHSMMHPAPAETTAADEAPVDEQTKIASAIRTDFILSAEIMAISLASITTPDIWLKGIVLALVGLLVTALVYGAVALIVKADDIGVHLANNGRLGATKAFGRGLVTAMPGVLKFLSFVGMLAMLWVGGGIIVHGLKEFGLGTIPYSIHHFAEAVGGFLPGALGGFITWLVDATIAGIIGLGLGWLTALAVSLFKPTGKAAH